MPLLATIVLAGAALYFMKPDERRRLAEEALTRLAHLVRAVREGREPYDELDAQLLARARRIFVTPVIVITWIGVWLMMRISATASPETLVAWGANYAPRTTHGEWSRLFTYALVHDGLFQLAAAVVAIVAIGMVLERLVGGITFAAVFVASAVVAGVVTLWIEPATAITSGGSAAVFGIIGLLVAALVYGYARAPRLPLSGLAARRVGAGIGIFLLVALATDALPMVSKLAGLGVGLTVGLIVARGVVERAPRFTHVALSAGAFTGVALLLALPFRGTIDARPAIARVADVETRTAADYAKAVDAYTQGRIKAKELALLIERTILPALAADRTRVEGLHGVPREQAPLVASAREYFDLREQSWRRRIEGLRGSNMKTLRDAEHVERGALDVYERMIHDAGVEP